MWKTAAEPSGILYNPQTMLVEPMDLHNVISGTGFTETNTHMQWVPHKPAYDPLSTTATVANGIAAARAAAAASAAAIASAAAAINRQLSAAGASGGAIASILANVTVLSEAAQAQAAIADNASRVLTGQNAAGAANQAMVSALAAIKPIMAVHKDGSLRTNSFVAGVKAKKKRIWTPAAIGGILTAIIFLCLLAIFLTRRGTRARHL